MSTKKLIPDKDADFDNFQANFIAQCTTNQVTWGIILTMLTALTPFQTAWAGAYNLCKNKKNATAAQRTAKNAAKKAYLAKLRPFIQSQIQYNATMTDAQRQQAGVAPKAVHRVPVPAPNTRPTMDAQPTAGSGVKIAFRQEAGSDGTSRRGKPDGVAFCKVVYNIGTVPTSPDACTQVEYFTKSPEVINFATTQAGQIMYGYGCWVNSRHEAGNWSEPFQCTIP